MGEGGAVTSHDEARPVDTGHRRELHERQIAARCVTDEFPWECKDREIRAGEFHRHPQGRGQRAGEHRALPRRDRHARQKKGADDSAGDADQAENARRGPCGDVAVLPHDDVHPRKGDRVKDQRVEKAVDRRDRWPRPVRRKKQQSDGNPCEEREVIVRERESQREAAREGEKHPRMPGKIHSGVSQRLMIALKPARSSALLADSAACSSGYGPTCT